MTKDIFALGLSPEWLGTNHVLPCIVHRCLFHPILYTSLDVTGGMMVGARSFLLLSSISTRCILGDIRLWVGDPSTSSCHVPPTHPAPCTSCVATHPVNTLTFSTTDVENRLYITLTPEPLKL